MTSELDALWAEVAHVARERLAVLEDAHHALRSGTVDRAHRRARALEEAEKLVGSLDSFGRTGGSQLAAQAAAMLSQDAPDLPALEQVLARLRAVVG